MKTSPLTVINTIVIIILVMWLGAHTASSNAAIAELQVETIQGLQRDERLLQIDREIVDIILGDPTPTSSPKPSPTPSNVL
jgi:hypothetical protein